MDGWLFGRKERKGGDETNRVRDDLSVSSLTTPSSIDTSVQLISFALRPQRTHHFTLHSATPQPTPLCECYDTMQHASCDNAFV